MDFIEPPITPSPLTDEGLTLERVHLDDRMLVLEQRVKAASARCPDCGHDAVRVHSRYVRTLADLPSRGVAVRLRLGVRRFRCEQPLCQRTLFTERVTSLAGLAAPYVRRTRRLADALVRVGTALGGDPLSLMEAMVSDVDVMRQQRPDLLVGTLADGAADVWAFLDAYINKEQLHTEVARLIDLWHNIEKLGKAARVIHGEQHSHSVVTRWKMLLLNDSEAASQILAELLASGRRDVRVGEARPVHEAITYLENHREQMDYATARRQGRPVGSGPVEASCKLQEPVRGQDEAIRGTMEAGHWR